MLIRVCAHFTEGANMQGIDEMIRIDGLPDDLMFRFKNGKRYLHARHGNRTWTSTFRTIFASIVLPSTSRLTCRARRTKRPAFGKSHPIQFGF